MSAFEAALTCSGGQAGGLEVWDLHTGSHLRSVQVANATGRLVPYDSRHVVLVQRDRPGLQVWAWKTGRQVARTPLPEHAEVVAVAPDRGFVAVGGRSGSVHLWQLPQGRLVRSWRAHYKAVTALSFTADGSQLVSAGADAVVCVWDAGEAADESSPDVVALAEWTEHSLPVTGLAVGAGRSPRAVTVSMDRTCRVWDVVARRQVASFVLPASLHAVALAPDESAAFAAGGDGRIFRVDLVAGAGAVAELAGHEQRCVALSLSADGSMLLSCGSDGQARLWDVRTCQAVRTLGRKWPQLHGGAIVRDAYGLYGDATPATATLPMLQKRPVPAPALASVVARVRPPASDPQVPKRRRTAEREARHAAAEPWTGAAAAAAAAPAAAAGSSEGDAEAAAKSGGGRPTKQVRKLEKEVRKWQAKCAALLVKLENKA